MSAVDFVVTHQTAIQGYLQASAMNMTACIVGKVALAAKLLPVLQQGHNPLMVFFDASAAGAPGGAATRTWENHTFFSSRTMSIQTLIYAGQPHFTVRRFLSEYPHRKCDLIVLEDVRETHKRSRVVDYLESHSWHRWSKAPHVVVAAGTSWTQDAARTLSVTHCVGAAAKNLGVAALLRSLVLDARRSGVYVGCFQHEMPFPHPTLEKLIETGS